jgi:putative nucleotidyltransferase with HDIG domain
MGYNGYEVLELMEQNDSTAFHRVSIDNLEVGMIVEDVFASDGTLLFSNERAINGLEQIELLKKRGVSSVTVRVDTQVNDNHHPDKLSKKESFSSVREAAYYHELTIAKEVHKEILETTKNVLSSVRMGKQFSIKAIESTAIQMVESVLRNPDALVSLSQIKGYDEYTFIHSVNVAILLTSFAHAMSYSPDQLLKVGVGGILHDIGKMRIPDRVLNKKGKFTDDEFQLMQKHPAYGIQIVKDLQSISELSKTVILQHHERFNGSGYPHKLSGNDISEMGMMAAVADVYDAMTTDRVYRTAWTPHNALALIFKGSESDYSRKIVELFTKNLGIYPVGSFVRLTTGEMGVVVRVDKGNLLTPDVLLLFGMDKKRVKDPYECRLSEKLSDKNGMPIGIEISLNPKDFNVIISEFITENIFK